MSDRESAVFMVVWLMFWCAVFFSALIVAVSAPRPSGPERAREVGLTAALHLAMTSGPEIIAVAPKPEQSA